MYCESTKPRCKSRCFLYPNKIDFFTQITVGQASQLAGPELFDATYKRIFDQMLNQIINLFPRYLFIKPCFLPLTTYLHVLLNQLLFCLAFDFSPAKLHLWRFLAISSVALRYFRIISI